MTCLWDYICTREQTTRASIGGDREGGLSQQPQGPSGTIQLFEGGWPVLPVTTTVESCPSMALLALMPGMAVVTPLTNGVGSFEHGDYEPRLTTEVKKVLVYGSGVDLSCSCTKSHGDTKPNGVTSLPLSSTHLGWPR